MKKSLLFIFFLAAISVVAQKKEKIKGSKLVTVEIKPVDAFENLDIADNLEIFFVKGTSASVEIDADDNLHEIVDISSKGKSLQLSTKKQVTGSKKFTLRITFTDDLKLVTLRNEVKASSLIDIDLESITYKCYDDSRLYINSKSKNFTLFLDDNSKSEINCKGEKTILNLSKNSELKALIASSDIKADLYQKAEAKIEGDCNNLILRLDNNTNFTGKNLVSKSAEIVTEMNSSASVFVKTAVMISATGKSEIEFYGDAKVDLQKFTDSAILKKKVSK